MEDTGRLTLEIISDWAIRHNLRISYDKCEALNIRRESKYLRRPPTLRIIGHSIRTNNSIIYLGITIDSTLSFLPHLNNKREELLKISQNLMKFATT